jgi:hypothetical protein
MPKKGLKVYSTAEGVYPSQAAKLKAYKEYNLDPDKASLFPLYGDIRDEGDIHQLGRTATIPEGKKDKTGFAYIAIPREHDDLTPLQQRQEFMDLVQGILGGKDMLNEPKLVEILADKIIEDEPDWPGNMTHDVYKNKISEAVKAKMAEDPSYVEDYGSYEDALEYFKDNPGVILTPDELDNIEIINGYDTQRDSPAEHRAQVVTPQQIIPLLNPLSKKDADFIVREMYAEKARHMANPDTMGPMTKKDYLRIGRKHGMSPYALLRLSKLLFYNDTPYEGNMEERLLQGSQNDVIRKIIEDIFKHEQEYDSDLRLKNIMPSIQRRFS